MSRDGRFEKQRAWSHWLHARFSVADSLVMEGAFSEIAAMSDSPEVAALRASMPTPATFVRCPRCGSRMGALEATSGQAHAASGDRCGDPCTDRYCGCCGLIVPIAR